jgi:hypothetical protein
MLVNNNNNNNKKIPRLDIRKYIFSAFSSKQNTQQIKRTSNIAQKIVYFAPNLR